MPKPSRTTRAKANRRQQSQLEEPPNRKATRDPLPAEEVDQAQEHSLGGEFSQGTFERHAALLADPQLSQPANARIKARVVRKLQSDFGNQYVQRLVHHLSAAKGEATQLKIRVDRSLVGPARANPTALRATNNEKEIVSTYHISARISKSNKSGLSAHGTDKAALGVASVDQSMMRPGFSDSLPGKVVLNVEEEPEAVSMQMTDFSPTIPYGTTINNDPGLPGRDEFGLAKASFIVSDVKVVPDTEFGDFLVTAKLSVPITWGVQDLGRTDIPNESSPDITADNVADVTVDLTPDMDSDGGRPLRDSFWASDLTEMHELFHASEIAGEYVPLAFEDAMEWLKLQVAEDEDQAREFVKEAVPLIMERYIVDKMGPGAEPRAYGDGAPLYEARVEKITKKADEGEYPD